MFYMDITAFYRCSYFISFLFFFGNTWHPGWTNWPGLKVVGVEKPWTKQSERKGNPQWKVCADGGHARGGLSHSVPFMQRVYYWGWTSVG